MKTNNFLKKLEEEAALQAKLSTTRIFPRELDALTSFIGRNSWQFVLVLSGLTALLIELLGFLVRTGPK
ncbi:MAG: hypothetical protein COY80_00075 [Candidatus Pacebacteria bacterium CG_4_10_14_0_8_um_filter_42_14]|nr:MAG: hypothetical protein COY80_00075 [Candidatus Pacebacteria bacterium CG_4_10_14_0_8_um_filter_42_14]